LSSKRRKAARQKFEVLQGEGKRFSFTNFKQALVFYVLLLLALVIIVQLGYHWLGEQFLSWRLKVFEAEIGMMRKEVTARGFVTRHEKVITAPSDVVIISLAPEGERIPAGEELIQLGLVSGVDSFSMQENENSNLEDENNFWDQFSSYWDRLVDSEDENAESSEAATPGAEAADQLQQVLALDEPADINAALSYHDTITIYAEQPGFVSYYCDSLEGYAGDFYPDDLRYLINLDQSDEENGEEFEEAFPGVARAEGDLVAAGKPLIKLIDNWQWYFSTVVPLHEGRPLMKLGTVNLEFEFAPGKHVDGELYHSELDEENQLVCLTYAINEQLPGFDKARLTGARILYRQHRGIIVPLAAVFEKEGETGIFINQGGRVVFKKISIVERQDDQVMIEGIEPRTLVITRPDLVEEGQRFR